ncbi:MAG: hypothetical protein PHH48_06495 [Eubacteriales bacterium]|nr:hypothetical protein [Eubacteriales bacterium]
MQDPENKRLDDLRVISTYLHEKRKGHEIELTPDQTKILSDVRSMSYSIASLRGFVLSHEVDVKAEIVVDDEIGRIITNMRGQ